VNRRQSIFLASLALLSHPLSASAQQVAIPPLIKVIVPFAPGAGTDVLARAVVAQLSTRLGTNIIVENRAGASGVPGVAAVAKGPRDGSVLLFNSTSLVTAAATARNVPYDVTTDLVPVAIVADGPMLIGVSAQAGIKTPEDLLAAARARPEVLTAGSAGVGSLGHLAVELLNDAAKIKIRHIPYKGAAPALVDVAAGTLTLTIGSYSTLAPQVQSGRVLPVALTSAQPNPAYPGVVPMGNAAPGYRTGIWYGLFAPAGIPPALLARLNRETNEVARSGDVRKLVEADGAAPINATPEELAVRVKQDYLTWKKLATDRQIVTE
jgi:tripartite-type tricarboxylate transporter receptor subunit TctC